MNISNKLSALDNKFPVLFAVLRVALGLILAIRGIYFLTTIQPLYYMIKDSRLNQFNIDMPLALFVCWAHTLGGTFIVLGLLTRIAVWVQIPIILGAILFINYNNILLTFTDLLLAIFVLILLILFAFVGGGKISMDNYVKGHLL